MKLISLWKKNHHSVLSMKKKPKNMWMKRGKEKREKMYKEREIERENEDMRGGEGWDREG